MINDEDCQVDAPILKDDVQSGSDHSWGSTSPSQSISPFLSTLRVAREITNLLKTLKAPAVSPGTLEYHDTQLNNCMALFPAHHQVQRVERLSLQAITPMIYLQNARLLLHRHNLSIMCPHDTRSAAIDQCFMIAKDTTQLLSRCLIDAPESPNQHPSSQHTWTWPFRSAASTFTCTHIWRCILFLCLRGDFAAASICVRVGAIVGNARPVNIACGRYVDFFLDSLTQKWHQDPRASVDRDEELIAYVSADLQGSIDHSWVWQDGEDSEGHMTHSPIAIAAAVDGETTMMSGVESEDDFGRAGWDAVLEKMERLLSQKPLRNRSISLLSSGAPDRTPSSNSPATASSRISIADIM